MKLTFTTFLLFINLTLLTAQLSTAKSTRLLLDSQIECLGDDFTIFNYEYGTEIDTAQNLEIINSIVEFIKANPNYILNLEFHSKCRLNGKIAIDYTYQRAKHFRDILINRGIDISRFSCKSRGFLFPISECANCLCSDQTDELNERIIVSLQSKKLKKIKVEYRVSVNANGDVVSAENINITKGYEYFQSQTDSLVFLYKFEPSILDNQNGRFSFILEVDTCQIKENKP